VNAKTLREYIRFILENNASLTVSERASGVTSLSSLVQTGFILFKRTGEKSKGGLCVCRNKYSVWLNIKCKLQSTCIVMWQEM